VPGDGTDGWALWQGVLSGVNATVFAYGATGSGKTYTMVGADQDPGLMVLSLRDIFNVMQQSPDAEQTVTCSYLEVYNEIIYDLLHPQVRLSQLVGCVLPSASSDTAPECSAVWPFGTNPSHCCACELGSTVSIEGSIV